MKEAKITQNSETVKQTIDIGRGVIPYTLQGKGPVLCLMATERGSWMGQAKLLSKRYTVLTYDMRGFGNSIARDPGFPSTEEQAEDLKTLLTLLGLNKIVLVGISYAGAVAQHFAVNFPEYLRGLVIVSSFAKPSGPTYIFLKLLHRFLAQGDLSTFWEMFQAFLYSGKNFSIILEKEKVFKRMLLNQYTCESLEHIYACSLKHDTTRILPKIKTPTLIIGGKEDMLFPPRITAELTSLIPGSQERLLDTAHVPPIEDPEGFLTTLEEFLESLQQNFHDPC